MTKLNIQNVSMLDRGVSYAEACFETFRVIDGAIFGADQHQYRLQQGARELGVDLNVLALQQIWDSCMKAATECADDSLIRVTITGGEASWGFLPAKKMIPNVYIQAQAFKDDQQAIHFQSVLLPYAPQTKTAKFTSDYAEVLRYWRSWQDDLIPKHMPLICYDGKILSAMTANVLIFRDYHWFTPQQDILAGIIRQVLLDSGEVRASLCPMSWLDDCEAMVLTNSGMFIRAADSINGRNLDVAHPSIIKLSNVLKKYEGVPEF